MGVWVSCECDGRERKREVNTGQIVTTQDDVSISGVKSVPKKNPPKKDSGQVSI